MTWGLDHVRAGTIRPTRDQTFALDQAEAAHTRLASGAALGNIVFDLS